MEYLKITIPIDDETKEGIKEWLNNFLDGREQKPKTLIQKESPTKDIMDFKTACQYLQIAAPTLYSYTSKRIIPYFKRSKKLYFKRSELDSWIEGGKKKLAEAYRNSESRAWR